MRKAFTNLALLGGGGALLVVSVFVLLLSVTAIPDFQSFKDRKVVSSTKIYDRTGQVLLFDVHSNVRRAVIPFDLMGINIRNATVAVEDAEFYQHKGIRPKSILRALWHNVIRGGFAQGGSTITQQLVKNTLLTREKTIARKIKEWIIAVKIESTMSKDELLEAYLNEAPYGGVVYGIEEAAEIYFGKNATDLSLAEAGYLAALPKAPSFYSPYGKNIKKLEERKNFILSRMKELGFIKEEDYNKAIAEKVQFLEAQKINIKAPHFVFFVKDYLEQKYGEQVMERGWKVTTTLDYDLEQIGEEIVNRIAKENEKNWDGKNGSLVAIDPKTGQILAMVGSRDYFEKEIDGSYNVALAKRQPGSAFKPFIYAAAFNKGYTPNTILFDVPTEFQTTCDAYGKAFPSKSQKDCYMPGNYDDKFRGPVTVRAALAQSINVPAVQMLYLVGLSDALKTARDMGITTLGDAGRYGLTLVIGGGETTLLDMTSAYATFASEGVRRSPKAILKVEDEHGNTVEEFRPEERTVLQANTVREISNILSDNEARTPTFGANSALHIPGRDVAVKTGTTNNNRDAWTIGYTPSIAVGVWVGNNENTPMKKGGVALAGPIWNAFMKEALKNLPKEKFEKPRIDTDYSLPPILRGIWQGGESYMIDKISGKLATPNTPEETKEEKIITNVRSILYWVDKTNPRIKTGIVNDDPQFNHWETATADWWQKNKEKFSIVTDADIPKDYDDVHVDENKPVLLIQEPNNGVFRSNDQIAVKLSISSTYPINKIDIYVNDFYIGSMKSPEETFSFLPASLDNINQDNTLSVAVTDSVYNVSKSSTTFIIQEN